MKIKIWGCRGSIPTPGPLTLRYGGNTTCLEVRPKAGGVIILDAGSGIRPLGQKLVKEKRTTELSMLITHSHWDHIYGFPFFEPAYSPEYKINVYGGPNAQASLKKYLSKQMTAPFFPVEFNVLKASFNFVKDSKDTFSIAGITITPIPLSHPNGGYGFKFEENGKSFVFLTDNEPSYPHNGGLEKTKYIKFFKKADLLLHDTQYTDEEYENTRGWGHSTFSETTGMAIEAGVKRFGLFHHDPDRSDDDLDRQLEKCQKQIEKSGVQIDCFAAYEGLELEL